MDNRPIKVKIDNVKKVYHGKNGKDTVALNGVSLDIKENEFVCIVGPSGCGKSTLLNIVAGLFPPSSGTVTCNGKLVEGTGVDRGVVFQQYALFPWLTVRKNIEFGLSINKVPDENGKRIDPVVWREKEEKKLRADLKYTVINENGEDRKYKANEEMFFDLSDRNESVNEINNDHYKEVVEKMRKLAISELKKRNCESVTFVKDGKLIPVPKETFIISPNYVKRLETSEFNWMTNTRTNETII